MMVNCLSCDKKFLDKNTIGINKKLLGDQDSYYCMDCLACFLDVSVEDLLDKIDEFKEEGCTLFN